MNTLQATFLAFRFITLIQQKKPHKAKGVTEASQKNQLNGDHSNALFNNDNKKIH